MATGTLWAVNTIGVSARSAPGTSSSARPTPSAMAATKRGCSNHAGANTISGAPDVRSRAAATSAR